MLKQILEEIRFKFKKLKYVGKNDYGFKIQFSNDAEHNLLDRIKDRTDLDYKKVQEIISRGIDYILKRWKSGKIKNRMEIDLHFTKSNFKTVILINPDDKYLRVKTILTPKMPTKRTIKWNLDEDLGIEYFIENEEIFINL
jgi:hypothetical protein